jgi:hypothetical protein
MQLKQPTNENAYAAYNYVQNQSNENVIFCLCWIKSSLYMKNFVGVEQHRDMNIVRHKTIHMLISMSFR